MIMGPMVFILLVLAFGVPLVGALALDRMDEGEGER